MHEGFQFCFMDLEGSVSSSSWNEIKKIEKKFLCYHLGVQSTTPYSVMLLETGRPIDFYALQSVQKFDIKNMDGKANFFHLSWSKTAGNGLQDGEGQVNMITVFYSATL